MPDRASAYLAATAFLQVLVKNFNRDHAGMIASRGMLLVRRVAVTLPSFCRRALCAGPARIVRSCAGAVKVVPGHNSPRLAHELHNLRKNVYSNPKSAMLVKTVAGSLFQATLVLTNAFPPVVAKNICRSMLPSVSNTRGPTAELVAAAFRPAPGGHGLTDLAHAGGNAGAHAMALQRHVYRGQ